MLCNCHGGPNCCLKMRGSVPPWHFWQQPTIVTLPYIQTPPQPQKVPDESLEDMLRRLICEELDKQA